MKSSLLLLALAVAASQARAVDGGGPIPTMFPAERYELLIAKSPFALATPPAPVAAPPEKNFADGWYVSGLAQLDGKDFVTIKSRDLAVQFSLCGEAARDGVTLQKVDWSPAVGRSTVTILKDGQTAKLEFNQADLQAGSAPPAPSGQPQGTVRSPMPVLSNPAAPRTSVPRPSQQPVVKPQQYQGLPNLNQTIPRPAGSITGGAAPTPDSHRRIRVINNVPAQ